MRITGRRAVVMARTVVLVVVRRIIVMEQTVGRWRIRRLRLASRQAKRTRAVEVVGRILAEAWSDKYKVECDCALVARQFTQKNRYQQLRLM